MSKRLDVLMDHIEPAEIARNPYVLQMSMDRILKRIKQMKAAGIDFPRTWIIICTPEQFNISIKWHSEEKEALGNCPDRIHFIAKQLHVDMAKAREIFERYPHLRYRSKRVRLNN